MPWDEIYLNRWLSFLETISKRYGARSSFVMIAAAGPTSVSSEMSLPNTDEDVRIWKKVEYTSNKYIGAWEKVFKKYAEIFPNQYFSLALYPGLPIPNKQERDRVRKEVINIGVLNYSKQFTLQTSGLNPLKDNDEGAGYQLVRQYKDSILTGFMMSSSFTEKQNKYGEPTEALKNAVERGLSGGARYLEVYEDDVINPNMQEILFNANQTLNQSK